MFFKWSGVVGGDDANEDGAKVGEDSALGGGRTVGSKSRSGRGGERRGLCVTFKSRRRSITLGQNGKYKYRQVNCFPYLMVSMTTIPLHLFLSDTLRRRPISITSSVKRKSSNIRAAHLYNGVLFIHALVYRVCRDDGIKGRYLGLLSAILARTVSWYMLVVFMSAVTIPESDYRFGN